MATTTSHTLQTHNAELTYDSRDAEASDKPLLLLVGCPMGASGFTTLAGHFTDRTVVTYDPRGVERSNRTDGKIESTTAEHAEDLSRLITEVATGPVDVFGSSGGAVNALALIAKHPEQVRMLVAHEPPAVQVLPDRDAALAVTKDIYDTYQSSGMGPAMAKFIALIGFEGELTDDYIARAAPDPAMFGLPTEDDGSRDDVLLGQNLMGTTGHALDFDALRTASTAIVLGVGAESTGTLANRGAHAVAERLGTKVEIFPSGHSGFMAGEHGQHGEPEAFAAKLREVLDAD